MLPIMIEIKFTQLKYVHSCFFLQVLDLKKKLNASTIFQRGLRKVGLDFIFHY